MNQCETAPPSVTPVRRGNAERFVDKGQQGMLRNMGPKTVSAGGRVPSIGKSNFFATDFIGLTRTTNGSVSNWLHSTSGHGGSLTISVMRTMLVWRPRL